MPLQLHHQLQVPNPTRQPPTQAPIANKCQTTKLHDYTYCTNCSTTAIHWQRAAPGIEPGTSRTLSENHTTRPSSQLTPAKRRQIRTLQCNSPSPFCLLSQRMRKHIGIVSSTATTNTTTTTTTTTTNNNNNNHGHYYH